MYEVTIKKVEQELITKSHYQVLSETGGEDGGKNYGYVDCEEMEKVETVVYTQNVENLNLVSVIDAVNSKK